MDDLIKLCQEIGISVEYHDLTHYSGKLLGMSFQNRIILDKNLIANPQLHRSVLAQEVGHLKSTTQRSDKK